MAKYQRNYDFQPGTRISSTQVDAEFDQLILAVNDLDTNLYPHLLNKNNPHGVTSDQINKIDYLTHNTSGDSYPNGLSYFSVSNPADGASWPDGLGYGTVFNIKNGNARFTQFFYHSKTNKTWKRSWYNDGSTSGWTTWSREVTENFDGVLSLLNHPMLYIRRTNALAVSSGVDTKINFDSVVLDTQGEYSTTANGITIKYAGNYLLSVQLIWSAPTTGDVLIKLFRDGTSFNQSTVGSAEKVCNLTRILTGLTLGSRIDIYVNQGNAAASLIQANLFLTKLH